jgi:hypothetical protein
VSQVAVVARRRLAALTVLLVLPWAVAVSNRCTPGPILFEEVTQAAGISYAGQSWGAAWGDLTGNGFPDLWTTNHGNPPSLYLNLRNGRFIDVASWLVGPMPGDMHGAAWVDLDNDGHQDLVVIGGGGGSSNPNPNVVLMNDGALVLTNRAKELGLDVPLGRGRTSQWWDWSGNGLLDVAIQSTQGLTPSTLYLQTPSGSFHPTTLLPETTSTRSPTFAQLADLNGDGELEMVSHGWPLPHRIYDLRPSGFVDVTAAYGLPFVGGIRDAALADFSGNLMPDLFMVRNHPSYSELHQPAPNVIRAVIVADKDAKGVDFAAVGNVSFAMDWNWPRAEIFIGAAAFSPSTRNVTLSSNDPAVHGMPAFVPGVDNGVYLGFDPRSSLWRVRVSRNSVRAFAFGTTTEGPSSATAVGFSSAPVTGPNALFENQGGFFVDRTHESGFAAPARCHSAGVGDFNNNMHLDIYLVCSGPARNLSNRLFLNRGDGTFEEVPRAGGAAGTQLGIGESVAVADYDRDGFLDLFVTNGDGPPPLHNGPSQLFRNLGNSNHWLQIDLVGIVSNRDAIGALVFVKAGGRTQVRAQTGGFHNKAQDFKRLHFGLGPHAVVQEILVQWPSGHVQVLQNVPANQILQILEDA